MPNIAGNIDEYGKSYLSRPLCPLTLGLLDVQAQTFPSLSRVRLSRSSPVPSRREWDPILAEESLIAAFQGTAISGQWVLRLRDTTAGYPNDGMDRGAVREAHGDGGVSGWEVKLVYSSVNL